MYKLIGHYQNPACIQTLEAIRKAAGMILKPEGKGATMPTTALEELIALLKANHNLVLTGAPGTG